MPTLSEKQQEEFWTSFACGFSCWPCLSNSPLWSCKDWRCSSVLWMLLISSVFKYFFLASQELLPTSRQKWPKNQLTKQANQRNLDFFHHLTPFVEQNYLNINTTGKFIIGILVKFTLKNGSISKSTCIHHVSMYKSHIYETDRKLPGKGITLKADTLLLPLPSLQKKKKHNNSQQSKIKPMPTERKPCKLPSDILIYNSKEGSGDTKVNLQKLFPCSWWSVAKSYFLIYELKNCFLVIIYLWFSETFLYPGLGLLAVWLGRFT